MRWIPAPPQDLPAQSLSTPVAWCLLSVLLSSTRLIAKICFDQREEQSWRAEIFPKATLFRKNI